MKLILKLLFVLISIATMILVLALFVEKKISIKEHIIVNQPVENIFDYVKFIDHQEEYFAWTSTTRSQEDQNNPADGAVGHTSNNEFSIESIGKGRFKIVELVPNKLIKCLFVRNSEERLTTELTIRTESTGYSETEVSFELSLTASYPYNIALLFSKMRTTELNALQKSVKNVKDLLESKE